MTENPEQQTFIKALKVATFEKGFTFAHNYGEKFVAWESVSHVFGLVYEKKNTLNLPLCIFLIEGSSALYCIDGNTTQIKDINGKSAQKMQFQSTVDTRKAKDEDLNTFIREICMRSTKTYIDRPLVPYVKGINNNLPSFTNSKELPSYCRKTMEALSESDFQGARVFEKRQEIPGTVIIRWDLEKWKEGTVLKGRYAVLRVMKGIVGTSYMIFDPEEARFYALKTFQQGAVLDDAIISRMRIQAKLWVKLGRHPSLVHARMVEEIEHYLCIFLDYVQGTDLRQMLRKGPLPLTLSVEFALQLCGALDYAYRKLKLTNCDIKTGNCLVTKEGVLRLNDAGLNKIFLGAQGGGGLVAFPQKSHHAQTEAAATIETLAYAAPELFWDLRSAGIKSDIYAFGVLLYEMLTRTNPFSSKSAEEVMKRHLETQPASPSSLNPEVPEALSQLVLKCIAKGTDNRFDDYREIMEDLGRSYKLLTLHQFVQPDIEEALSESDWLGMGKTMASLGRHGEAAVAFEKVIAMNREVLDALISKAASLVELGKTREAYAVLSEAMARYPADWRVYFNMAEIQWEAGSIDKALSIIEAGSNQAKDKFQLLIKKSRLLIRAERYEEALDVLEEPLKVSPRNIELLFRRALMLLGLGYFEECRSLCSTILEINPHHVDSRLICNKAIKMLKNKDMIIEAIHSASDISKDFIIKDINTLLAVFCNVRDALFYLDTLGEDGRINYLRASLHLAEGDWESCTHYIGRALKLKSVINDEGNIDMDNYFRSLKETLKDTDTQDAVLRLKILVKKLQEIEKDPFLQASPEAMHQAIDEHVRRPEHMLLYGLKKLREKKGKEARDLFKMALTADPTMTACGYFVGKTLELAGDSQNALVAYNEFINKFPDSTGYWKEMLASQKIKEFQDFERVYHRLIGNFSQFHHYWISYLLYLTVKKHDERAKVIASHLLGNYGDKPANLRSTMMFWSVKGLLQLFLTRHREAIQSFKEALKDDRNDLTSLIGILKSLVRGGQPGGAAAYLDRLKDCADNSGIYEYFSSEMLVLEDSPERAIAVIERGLKKNPGALPLLMKKARYLIDKGKYERFFEVRDQILSLEPAYNPVKMLNIMAFVASGKINKAIPEITTLIADDPANLGAQKNLGIIHIYLDQPREAKEVFDHLLESFHDDYELYLGKGICHYLEGDFKKARENFSLSITLNPTDSDVWQFMGAAEYCLGNHPESEKCWDRAILYGGGFSDAWINKGYFFYYRQKWSLALEHANKALRISQQNVHAWVLRAQCQWKLGGLLEALQSVEKAISLSPQDLKALIVRGLLEFYNKNYELSFKCLEKATSLDNKNPDLWYNRALSSLFLNDHDEAKKSLERCSVIYRFNRAQTASRGKGAAKTHDHCSIAESSYFQELIAHYTIETESYAEVSAQAYYDQARDADPTRFKIWAEDLRIARNPRYLLKPLETRGNPFVLPFKRPLVTMEPLEIFHYPDIRELFAGKPELAPDDSESAGQSAQSGSLAD
jgi:tetratricopeptide (TPR) repeat protein